MRTTIKTQRLILRPVTLNDVQDFFEMDSNPEVHKYLGNQPVKSIEQSKIMIKAIIEQYQSNGLGRLAIITKETNQFVGWAGLKLEQNLRKTFDYYDIGYRLKQKFWGNGYATEAALAALNYGFKTLKLNKICGAADVNNLASNHILKKIGMQPQGTFKYKNTTCNWYVLQLETYLLTQ